MTFIGVIKRFTDPSEKYAKVKMGSSSPQVFGVNIKKICALPPRILVYDQDSGPISPTVNTRVFQTMQAYMDVSENRGTPKSSILIGFSIINHPFLGTPIFGNPHMTKT